MRITPVLAAAAAGAALAAGGVAFLELGTDNAEAQSGGQTAQALPTGPVTQVQLQAANNRSIRAIKQGTAAWNLLAKYRADKGALISLMTPRISQQAGTGSEGLPESTLSEDVQSQLNTIYAAAVFNTPGAAPTLSASKGATAVTRTPSLPIGAFDVAFGTNDISKCTWTASVGTVQPGALTPVFGPFITYSTLLNSTTLRVFTFSGAGGLADAPFQVQVIC